MELTQEQKRSKIAEAVGKNSDYFNDLNACHEMEKAVPVELMGVMAGNLCRVVGFFGVNNTGKFLPHEAYMWHATAAQRAEAFGKTLNFW